MSQVNLKEKTVVELKAIAYDLANLAQNYSQMLQVVNQEINSRNEATAEAAGADKFPGKEVDAPKAKKKLTVVPAEA